MGHFLLLVTLGIVTVVPVLGQQDEMISPLDTARVLRYHKLASESGADDAMHYEQQALNLSISINYTKGIVTSYTNLGALHRNRSGYFRAIQLYKKAIEAAPDKDQPYLADTYLELGIAYLRMIQLDSARASLLQGLKVNERRNDPVMEGSLYNMLGNVLKDQDDYQQAVSYYLKAESLFRKVNYKSGLTQVISNIGNMEYLLKNYDKALAYAQESLVIAKEINQQSSVAYSNRLIGRIYRQQGKLDSAVTAYNRAVKIYQALGARRDVSETYYNTANIFFEKGDLNTALQYYQSALAIQRSIPDTLNMAYTYSAIGQAYVELRRYREALLYLDSASVMAEQKKLPYVMLDVYAFTSMIHSERKEFEQAYRLHIRYAELNDSLIQNENRLAAQELENQYQAKKKEEEIKTLSAQRELAELQLHKRNTQRNYLLGIALLAMILLVVLYNRYKIKGKTAQKLEELDRVKSRFFTNLSHELRTPLSLITGPLQKRLSQADDVVEKEELELMYRNANRLNVMINQLLDLAKLESGNMRLHVSEYDLSQMLRLITSSFASFAEQRGIQFEVDIPETDVVSYVDQDKFEKIIYNLLSNALKFTPAQGKVSLRAEVDKKQVAIMISDTGTGIPEDKLLYVFDRFYQVDDTDTRFGEGTGIGLALCKELAGLHRGDISVQSEEGRGSTFTLTIPTSREAYCEDDLIPGNDSHTVSVPLSGNGTMNLATSTTDTVQPLVLVAEDNDDMRLFISKTLMSDYRVESVINGREAFERAKESVPDLIVTDVMMPDMDGHTLCHRLKNEKSTGHIPVIMLTAKADLESKLEGLQTGADDYLTKPFDARELMVRIQNLIQQRKQLQDLFRERIVLHPQQLDVTNPTEKFLTQVLEVLERNYSNPAFGVDQLAEHVALSRTQLHRKLKALTDTAPGDFLRQFRLERAKQLLGSGAYQVSEVAYQTGFNNLSNFTRAFKDFTGMTPSEFLSTQAL